MSAYRGKSGSARQALNGANDPERTLSPWAYRAPVRLDLKTVKQLIRLNLSRNVSQREGLTVWPRQHIHPLKAYRHFLIFHKNVASGKLVDVPYSLPTNKIWLAEINAIGLTGLNRVYLSGHPYTRSEFLMFV